MSYLVDFVLFHHYLNKLFAEMLECDICLMQLQKLCHIRTIYLRTLMVNEFKEEILDLLKL